MRFLCLMHFQTDHGQIELYKMIYTVFKFIPSMHTIIVNVWNMFLLSVVSAFINIVLLRFRDNTTYFISLLVFIIYN